MVHVDLVGRRRRVRVKAVVMVVVGFGKQVPVVLSVMVAVASMESMAVMVAMVAMLAMAQRWQWGY